jgi:peptide chain release factor subunit 3
MSQNPQRGFNPNAPSFTPNPNAIPFIPGQRYAPQQQHQQPPPQYYQQQQQYPGYPPPGYMGNNPIMYMQQQQQQQQPPMQIGQWQQQPPISQPFHHQKQQPSQEPNLQQQEKQFEDLSLKDEPKVQQQEKQCEAPPQQAAESWDDGAEDVVPEKKDEIKKEEAPPKEKEVVAKEVDAPKSQPKEHRTEEVVSKSSKMTSVNVEEMERTHKEHLNIVFIGHVDAGKSTIGGQLMFLTGMVDKRTLEKYEREAKEKGRESWYLSWALDTNDEEREKGKTVEVGRAYFETEKKHFTILDAPGHKSFVPNMITGATQADLAVLVISARRGEFETGFDRGGQTREHAMLVKTAGVKHLIILVNKMDDPTVKFDEARYNEIQEKLTPFLRKCGFNPKTDLTYIPCSGLTGAFIKERPDGDALWYTGPCFLEFIDGLAKISRDFGGPLRMIVSDKYTDMGTIVMGKLESGVINKGQNVLLMPNRATVQVIQCFSDEDEVDQVAAGDNVRLKLKGIEENEIMSGFVICSTDYPCRVGKVFDAEVMILELKSIMSSGYTCVLHLHSAVEEVIITKIICKIDKKTQEKKKTKFVKQDDKCIVRIEAAEPFCLDTYKEFPVMGRFTLRDEGKTIGIGKVVKVVE